ncbi:hypothetical protein T265_02703 [Opisthorchis viverrini]|uniref:Uncharacterized protein n=1 Tax=Opisthorchis viverrini TaxID=6198 RepID=A0A075A5X4_OPIVI|nr:hypothetical protein T265_02703 [Opisthorchis viverrini]KER31030.1 hypothetical protein T265_02703 [Opisthorchis viverrini]
MSINVDILLSRLPPTISSSAKAELGSVLSEYTDVFAWKDYDVGRTKAYNIRQTLEMLHPSAYHHDMSRFSTNTS